MAMALGFLTVMKILVTMMMMMMMNNSSMVIKGDVIAVDNCTATSTTINSHNHSNSKNPENYKGKYDDDDDDELHQNVEIVSILGDGGMRDERVRVGLESWNFCNKVGFVGDLSHGTNHTFSDDYGHNNASMPSPRRADCTDLICVGNVCEIDQLVTTVENDLKFGQQPSQFREPTKNEDEFAIQKELYLGSLCETTSTLGSWQFWMIMLKNGNFDLSSGLCPSTALPTSDSTKHPFISIKASSSFPCFGPGCMNHPLIFHNVSTLAPPPNVCVNSSSNTSITNDTCIFEYTPSLVGSFYGTYDLDIVSNDNGTRTITPDKSYFSIDWHKDPNSGSWVFHHVLRVSKKYPWLMLYLRADATKGPSGGYPWETRGMMVEVPESPNFLVILTLNVLKGGGPSSQFYLLDIGGCWKNDGMQCDGNTTSDVTRYSEMIINPSTPNWCRATDLSLCPPYHIDAKTGRRIYRNDTTHFPYEAYHLYCVSPIAKFAEPPFRVCDPYSNPQPQEIMQLLPHPEWAVHGYPSTKGQGWVGDARTWTLDVGGLSQRLYFYQDPNTPPAVRRWTSIDVGTKIFISQQVETAEWLVSDFDVLVEKGGSN